MWKEDNPPQSNLILDISLQPNYKILNFKIKKYLSLYLTNYLHKHNSLSWISITKMVTAHFHLLSLSSKCRPCCLRWRQQCVGHLGKQHTYPQQCRKCLDEAFWLSPPVWDIVLLLLLLFLLPVRIQKNYA